MPIVAGKIIRDKSSKKEVKPAKKKKSSLKAGKDIREEMKEDKKSKTPEKKKKKIVPVASKKSSKHEDFIRTGANAGLRIELSEFNGKDVIAIRKLYCTSADPEMKVGKGGFNLPSDKETLDSVISALKEIRKQL